MDDSRLMLTDETWQSFEAVLRQRKSPAGAPPELSDRDFVEAMLFIARTGCPWRDLPRRFGKWDAVYQRFRRWEDAGHWRALFEQLPMKLEAVRILFVDSTVIRAHPHAAGAPGKKGGKRRRRLDGAAAGSGPN
jgi:transposase